MSRVEPVFKAVQGGIPKRLPTPKGIRTSPKKLVPNSDFKKIMGGALDRQRLPGAPKLTAPNSQGVMQIKRASALREFAQNLIRSRHVLA